MAFYVFNFGINMFVGKGLLMCNKKGWYRIFTIVQLTLIAGLRAESVGLDTHTYLEYFDHLSGTVNVGEAIRRLSWVEPGYVFPVPDLYKKSTQRMESFSECFYNVLAAFS